MMRGRYLVTGPPLVLAQPCNWAQPRSRVVRSIQTTRFEKGLSDMSSFSYATAAELFPAAIRKKKRAGFAYRRFDTAADAVRYAIEELPADSLTGAYLQVDEVRFDHNGIRNLYNSADFPLERRADADAA